MSSREAADEPNVEINGLTERASTWERPRPKRGLPLSEREIEVLALAADGLTDAHIATRLDLAACTVTDHIKSILEKLDVSGRAHAVAVGFRTGLLT
jgi:DNA-binding NarL/FixJ family response regulator